MRMNHVHTRSDQHFECIFTTWTLTTDNNDTTDHHELKTYTFILTLMRILLILILILLAIAVIIQ